MNEVTMIRLGYLALCTFLAIILPHITSVDDVPTAVQILMQLIFVGLGVGVYVVTRGKLE